VGPIRPGSTWDRLVRVKARYDPTNLFHHNYNIPTAISQPGQYAADRSSAGNGPPQREPWTHDV
jgi:hypothetical protein